eukprot:CAMPEP_0194153990 /NCGR_PEP_ID=MMETSP0152-20130528/58761_1 /TAXON_ID=1049557 /ORGANISM="Thalassiothrix antarctica, Strain L6-D1" /LENGTH=55 /DNA_ID=CAMNT_0038859735 /DNA_START=51 /DNA_END=215 /DNA_ORIENTATION=+
MTLRKGDLLVPAIVDKSKKTTISNNDDDDDDDNSVVVVVRIKSIELISTRGVYAP